jgi:hexosaminidase
MKVYFYTRPAIFLILFSILFFQSCKQTESPTDLTQASLIPKPVSVEASGKTFVFDTGGKIYVDGNEDIINIGNFLSSELSIATGIVFPVDTAKGQIGSGNVVITLGGSDELGPEGYELTIDDQRISIKANKPAGAFYGVQTLLQLVPVSGNEDGIKLPTGHIKDYPSYEWRGSMLDVARHFFSVQDVKRYIDLISSYKMNVLHLHLTDDQGWRIEIKSWPNLALHGGATQVGGGKGGYYTQEEFKDLIAYAHEHYVTIVPEIDLPGHINAALASYGSLRGKIEFPAEGKYTGELTTQGITDGNNLPTDLYTGIEVGWSTLYLDKPATFTFLNDVIRELSALTPDPYIHIGGDEAHATEKSAYIEFINRITEIVKANKKQMIGWEEIAQANIDNNAIAQHWASEGHAQEAAKKGARIIMSPSKKVYLDMQYDSTSKLGLHWAAFIEVDDSYDWDPATRVKGISRDNILGVEAPLWSETISTMDDIEYLLFPRLPGVAEIAWTPVENRSWDDYKVRLGKHGPHMKSKGIDYYPSKRVPWVE